MKMYVLFLIAVMLVTGVNCQLIKANLGKQYAGEQASASSGPPHMNKYLRHGEPGDKFGTGGGR